VDQRDWGLLRETVVRRTQAAGASKEDAEDATHDALLAAIGEPEHPRSQVAWVSTVAQRRRVDLIRQRVRQERVSDAAPGGSDPTAAGPEDQVVDRAHATWLAASLTQLPPTTREVVDAVGAGMTPAEVAHSMNLSTRSVESHLTRARRHLRRMGALGVPLLTLIDSALRARSGTRIVTTAAVAVTVPVVVAAVTLLPSSTPMHQPGAAPAPPGATLPAPAATASTPRSGPAAPAPAAGGPAGPVAAGTSAGRSAAGTASPGTGPAGQDGTRPAAEQARSAPEGTAERGDGSESTAETSPAEAAEPPTGRSLPPPPCSLQLPVVGDLGCVLAHLVGGANGGAANGGAPAPAPGR
jgi:RNA polymerase sigma factor (sigma-70 family)